MLYRMFIVVIAVLLGALPARGAPTADSAGSGGAAPASALSGTWTGSFWQVGGVLYTNDANVVLEIKEDGTFSARVAPAGGANNRATASTWTGTVVSKGDRVTLRTAQGPWMTLARRGDTLYGVANDPATQATVMITLRREDGQARLEEATAASRRYGWPAPTAWLAGSSGWDR
jgi:hypothetical protein